MPRPNRRHRSISGGSYQDMSTCTEPSVEAVQATARLMRTLLVVQQQHGGGGILHSSSTHNGHILALQSALLDRARQLDSMIERMDEHTTSDINGNLRRAFLRQPDHESGYTPLHAAAVQGDFGRLLLLLRHALMENDDDSPRMSQRPMHLLERDGSSSNPATTTTSIVEAMASARDWEGLTPVELLRARQAKELEACRRSLYCPTIVRDRSTQRQRHGSFDIDEDEQNELDVLSRQGHLLQPTAAATVAQSAPARTEMEGVSYGCEVFTFGGAHHCALGVVASSTSTLEQNGTGTTGTQHHLVRPHRVQAFGQSVTGRARGAVAVAGATHHTLVATADGALYAFGLGKAGRLGTGDESHCALPTRVLGPLSSRRVIAVAAAENHSLCVTTCGSVYAWGSNRFGQLGLTTTTATMSTDDATAAGNNRCLPRRVDELKGIVCVDVAAGARHSVALTKHGHVYVWGDNTAGQLATSRRSGIHKVQRVDALWNSNKVALKIAASEQATLVLVAPTGSGLPVNSIYSWGHGSNVPSKVHFETSREHRNRPVNPVAIACARYHSVAIAADGLVYTWGLHSEPLGTPKSSKKKTPAMSSVPQLVTGMLSENGGGIAVAVSASENHTAILTDCGALYTWGATYGKNILGHEGVRWQPDPRRVPGVYRAVAVAAAKEHTILLVGASFPSIPPSIAESSLETLAARRAAEHVDLFNVLPVLIIAERTQSSLLIDYCNEFVRRNIDGVLNVGQKSNMDCYLNEQLTSYLIDSDKDRDGRHHPLLLDVITAGNDRPSFHRAALSSTEEWIAACSVLLKSRETLAMVERYRATAETNDLTSDGQQPTRRLRSISSGSLNDQQRRRSRSDSCSERCITLTTNMDLSSKELAEAKLACINKEIRGARKRLSQITKLEDDSKDVSLLTSEQREKLARRPQLQADLSAFEPALEVVEKRLKEIRLSEEKADLQKVDITDYECSEKGATDRSEPVEKEKVSFRCDVCQVSCPDEKSHTLHINGRKHRNRVAMAVEKEQEQVAVSILEERQRQQVMKASTVMRPVTGKGKSASPWKREKGGFQPQFNLPPPPHPIIDTVVNPPTSYPSETKSLREIMEEESSNVGRVEASMSSRAATSKPAFQLPPGSAAPMKSPPWASHPVARVQVPAATQPTTPKATHSLGDFLKPQSQPPKVASPLVSGWASPKASPAQAPSPAVSFRDIQQQEHAFKVREDQTFGANGKWFIERRERAGSFKEIQTETSNEREERLMIEEQFQIESQIQEELAVAKKKQEQAVARKRSRKPKKSKSPGASSITKSSSDGSGGGQAQPKSRRQRSQNKKTNKGAKPGPKPKQSDT